MVRRPATRGGGCERCGRGVAQGSEGVATLELAKDAVHQHDAIGTMR